MSSQPLITILTPVYNGAGTITKCLESIATQSFKNIEHLILDGLSTDGTVEVIKKYQDNFDHIRLISEKDSGVYDAMNKGILKASGSWIYFLGADDYLMDQNILQQIAGDISKYPQSRMIYGNVWHELLGRNYDGVFNRKKIMTRNICHQAIFYHSNIFPEYGLFDTTFPSEADYAFNLRLFFLRNFPITFVDRTIAFFSEGGLSGKGRDRVLTARFFSLVTNMIREGDLPLAEKLNCYFMLLKKWLYRRLLQSD